MQLPAVGALQAGVGQFPGQDKAVRSGRQATVGSALPVLLLRVRVVGLRHRRQAWSRGGGGVSQERAPAPPSGLEQRRGRGLSGEGSGTAVRSGAEEGAGSVRRSRAPAPLSGLEQRRGRGQSGEVGLRHRCQVWSRGGGGVSQEKSGSGTAVRSGAEEGAGSVRRSRAPAPPPGLEQRRGGVNRRSEGTGTTFSKKQKR